MTAVLTVRVGAAVAGSCGKACYDAEHDDCSCVCGGMNHRAGLERAAANTRAHAAAWIAQARADGQDITSHELGLPVTQHFLF